MRPRILVTLVVLAAVVGAWPSIPRGDAAAVRATDAGPTRSARIATSAIERFVATHPAPASGLHASAGAPAGGGVTASAAPGRTSLTFTDVANDAQALNDLTEAGVRVTRHSVRLTARAPSARDPKTFPGWYGDTGLFWYVDAGADGTFERIAAIFGQEGGGDLIGTVFGNTTTPNELCAGNATLEPGGRFALQVPAACLGSPAKVAIVAEMFFGYSENQPVTDDWVPDFGYTGAVQAATTTASSAGAFVLDAAGALRRVSVGGAAPAVTNVETARVVDPRGVATTPDGAHGYVVDGTGALHAFSTGRNELPPYVYGVKRWPGQSVARGIAIRPNGSAGLVVDGFGNLFPFGIGGKRAAPTLVGVPKWPGVDIARGVAVMPDGSGGFTVDAFGGLHWFSIGASHAAPAVYGAPSFPGSDAARGITILPDGTGGFVVDKTGALHWFSIGVPRAKPAVSGVPALPATNGARGVSVLTRLISKPVAPVDPRMPLVGEYVEDVVVDATGHFAYATRNAGSIEVLDLDSRTQVASIPVGKNPTGLALTADGTKLYVAVNGDPQTGLAPGSIAVIDVATRQVTKSLTLPTNVPGTYPPMSIAILANGKALVQAADAWGSGGWLFQLDLATDTFVRRTELDATPGALSGSGRFSVSGDRMHAGIASRWNQDAITSVYDVATDSFVTKTVAGQHFLEMDEDGNRILLDGTWIYNGNLSRLGTIMDGTSYHGILTPDGAVAYRAGSRLLQKVDVATHTVTTVEDLHDEINYRSGHVAMAGDGSRIVVVTDHGLAVFDV